MLNRKRLAKTYTPKVTSKFGNRVHPVTKEKQFHKGVDYQFKEGVPEYAISDGKVLKVGKDGQGNTFAYVEFTKLGYVGLYMHGDIKVKKGQIVDENTIIATSNSHGRTTGSHLHFGWFKKSEYCKSYSSRNWEDFEKYKFKEIIKIPTIKIYIVKKGDTLTSIAKKYKTTIIKIAKDNKIKNANIISIGQKLIIK